MDEDVKPFARQAIVRSVIPQALRDDGLWGLICKQAIERLLTHTEAYAAKLSKNSLSRVGRLPMVFPGGGLTVTLNGEFNVAPYTTNLPVAPASSIRFAWMAGPAYSQ